jgi:hypothetical protein
MNRLAYHPINNRTYIDWVERGEKEKKGKAYCY